MPIHKIKTKEELAFELNNLFKDIYKNCKNCKYIDCRGYIWLHPIEIKEICRNANTIRINDEITFIDSFIRENGNINPSILQPKCYLRDSFSHIFQYL